MNTDMTPGTCQLRANHPTAKWVSPWEGRRQGELTAAVLHRHQAAKVACALCPRLEACEAFLSDFEKKDIEIDGIVAGRYSDVTSWWRRGRQEETSFIQSTCRACQEEMKPQARARRYQNPATRRHVGEGMCDQCHPVFSRAARRGAA